MKIAIYSTDKERLQDQILEILLASQIPRPPDLWASAAAREIINLLEREGVWDHVVED